MKLFGLLSKKKKYTLVISGGGTRGFYALGILKGLEELGYKDRIEAIYGVSAGAIVGSYRSAGYSAQEIFDMFIKAKPFGLLSLNIFFKKSLLKLNFFEKKFTRDLPQKITDLKIKTYLGTTDIKTGRFVLFEKGDLVPILLGSMSIPGIFPIIRYKNHILVDGGATNNFPVEFAKKAYPHKEIIGIVLNKFQENQEIKNIFDSLSISFEILLRHQTIEHISMADHLFHKNLSLKVLDISREKMRKAYAQGYEDCMKHFK